MIILFLSIFESFHYESTAAEDFRLLTLCPKLDFTKRKHYFLPVLTTGWRYIIQSTLKSSFISYLIFGKSDGNLKLRHVTISLYVIEQQRKFYICTLSRDTVFICSKIILNIFDRLSLCTVQYTTMLLSPPLLYIV
jgi:hypothetical protein